MAGNRRFRRMTATFSSVGRSVISSVMPRQSPDADAAPDQATEIHLQRHPNGVLELRLVGASRRNALGRSTIDRLEDLVSVPPLGTRVIVLTAEEPDFCAGYDLREAARGDAEQLIANGANFASLKRAGVPLIAALHGNVIGGGLELALAADVRLATPTTKFELPAGRLGLVYSEDGIRLLVDQVGESRARAMLLAGRALTAEEAKTSGLISEIVDTDDLYDRAIELASTIASWSPVATSGNRRVLDVVAARSSEDIAALRLASFEPGGALASSIERFASGQPAVVNEVSQGRPALLAHWRATARAAGGRISDSVGQAWWLLGTRAGDRLHRSPK